MIKSNKQIYEENNLFIQSGGYECGPSAIKNVQRMLSVKENSINELIEFTQAKPFIGTSNKNIIRTLKVLGFYVEEYKNSSLDAVKEKLDEDFCIISNYMNSLHETGHYTVIEDVSDNNVYLRDSSIGLAKMHKNHYERLWYDKDGIASRWFIAIKKHTTQI